MGERSHENTIGDRPGFGITVNLLATYTSVTALALLLLLFVDIP
jgi:hypothetical protein